MISVYASSPAELVAIALIGTPIVAITITYAISAGIVVFARAWRYVMDKTS